MNYFVERYRSQRHKGFNPIEALGIVASAIAAGGTIDDLKEVYEVYWDDAMNITGGIEDESTTTTVSKSTAI